MMPLYTSQELKAMVHACTTHDELDRVEYLVWNLTSEELPSEIRKRFSMCVGIKRIDLIKEGIEK